MTHSCTHQNKKKEKLLVDEPQPEKKDKLCAVRPFLHFNRFNSEDDSPSLKSTIKFQSNSKIIM